MVPATEPNRLAVSVEHLSIVYQVRSQRSMSAAQYLRSGFRSRSTSPVQSIRDLSVDIGVGEVVGLVGRNGAGKSTLMSAIAGLVPPTEGTVLVRSQPTLLGVGAALMPKLSGSRNVTVGALAMGLPLSEVDDVRSFVADFTELGDALDRPLNTYSSGMKARLAFALATYRLPEIMLIDEALAVGDKAFRSRSLARVRELQAHASTVIMATHNLREIRRTCSRAIWLDGGEIVMDGPVGRVLEAYDPDD